MRTPKWSVLVLVAALAWPAAGLERKVVKSATDRAGNWLVEQHNLGQGTFGKSRYSELPGFNALVIKALCESPRQYRETLGPFISEPVKCLLKAQREDGAIARPGAGIDGYNTALAILALKATANPAHAEAIAKAKDYLLKCQGKDGGFSYDQGRKQGGDLSNTVMDLLALEAAGLEKGSKAYRKAVAFIRRCQDNPETNPDLTDTKTDATGGAYYQPGVSGVGTTATREGRSVPKPYGGMTAALIESLLICDLKPDAPELQAAFRFFRHNYSVKENPGAGMQGYFYYALAFARAMKAAGIKELELADGKKAAWAEDLAAHLMAIQAKDDSFANPDPKWMEDDPVLCTAYALQALTVCYEAMK